MSVGVLSILREETEHGCVWFEQILYPNGRMGVRNEYSWGRLYLREPDFERYVKIMEDDPTWEVRVAMVPSYAQMSGPKRS